MTCKINADTSDGLKLVSDTSGEIDLQIDASTKVHMASDGKVGIGTTSPAQMLHVKASDARVRTEESSGSTTFDMTNTSSGHFLDSSGTNDLTINKSGSANMVFKTVNAEKMRLTNAGHGELLVSTTDGSPWNNNNSDPGCGLNTSYEGLISSARSGGDPLALNRMASDGDLLAFYRDGSVVGTISVSGGNVTYGAFTGNHPSRLVDNTNPTILKGTVIETLDTMCSWYELEFTTAEGVPKHTEIVLPDDKSVGDSHTMDYLGESVTGKIIKRDNNKHTLCKISDTEDSARVYGVFADYSNGDEVVYNDMLINAVGTSVVRVASGVTVSAGDLLSSKGDGTAKLQGDDIIKTKTIGKVLSNIKQETYDDGSFTVPCALYCG